MPLFLEIHKRGKRYLGFLTSCFKARWQMKETDLSSLEANSWICFFNALVILKEIIWSRFMEKDYTVTNRYDKLLKGNRR